MTTKDLRIGNFVYGFGEFAETALPICCLNSDNTLRLTIFDQSAGCFHVNRVKPIPLTEEWLDKFGFKQWGKYYHLWKIESKTKCTICTTYSDNGEFRLNENYGVRFRYVHELQNLYFAITSKELEIIE